MKHPKSVLMLSSVALAVLVASSFVYQPVSQGFTYAQFTYAYSQTTQKCPNFLTPVQIMTYYLGSDAYSNSNRSSTWYQQHAYLKSFSVSGLGLNSTNLSFDSLSMTILTTREHFYNSSGQIIKSSSENITVTISINGFNTHITDHQAQITIGQISGTYRVANLGFGPVIMTGSAENIRATIACEGS